MTHIQDICHSETAKRYKNNPTNNRKSILSEISCGPWFFNRNSDSDDFTIVNNNMTEKILKYRSKNIVLFYNSIFIVL